VRWNTQRSSDTQSCSHANSEPGVWSWTSAYHDSGNLAHRYRGISERRLNGETNILGMTKGVVEN
jgi:hypothetical protein